LVCSRWPHPSSSWSWLVMARGQPTPAYSHKEEKVRGRDPVNEGGGGG
jgi:hypothetical protein